MKKEVNEGAICHGLPQDRLMHEFQVAAVNMIGTTFSKIEGRKWKPKKKFPILIIIPCPL